MSVSGSATDTRAVVQNLCWYSLGSESRHGINISPGTKIASVIRTDILLWFPSIEKWEKWAGILWFWRLRKRRTKARAPK